MRRWVKTIFVSFALVAAGCSVDTSLPPDRLILCDATDECPDGLVCVSFIDAGRCVAPTDACVAQRGDQHVPAADGNACPLPGSDEIGICVAGACRRSECGDGFVDIGASPGEECDAGVLNSDFAPDGCRADCKLPACGDGIVDSGEECDDGKGPDDPDEDECTSRCELNWCGDGVVNRVAGAEECDDNNDINEDSCTNECLHNICGDRYLNAGGTGDCDGSGTVCWEECDDGSADIHGQCPACRNARCGDGVVWLGVEVCDDGDAVTPENCAGVSSENCALPCADDCSRILVCGDGVADVNGPKGIDEPCDDGNSNPNDGCANDCRITAWTASVLTGYGSSGGAPLLEPLINPTGIAADSQDNLYFTDPLRSQVFRLDALTGNLTVVAGSGRFGLGGEGVPARSADLIVPTAVAVDDIGNVYFVERDANRVRKVDSHGMLHTVVGTGLATSTGDGGLAVAANVNSPVGVATDAAGNLYIAEGNGHRIRKVDVDTGIIRTLVGSGTKRAPTTPPAPCPRPLECDLDTPAGVTVAADGTLYFTTQGGSTLRRLDANGVTTILDNNILDGPIGVAVAADGTLFVADAFSARVLKVLQGTAVPYEVIAGDPATCSYGGDGGLAVDAELNIPIFMALTRDGSLYFADVYNGLIRRIDTAGGIDRVVGQPPVGVAACAGAGPPPAESTYALIADYPGGLDIDGTSYVIAARDTHVIARLSNVGELDRIAGSGLAGYLDGPGAQAQFANPRGVAVFGTDDYYIADRDNHAIRRVVVTSSVDGVVDSTVTTIAGTGVAGYSGDGGLARDAQLNSPTGLSFSTDRRYLYIADFGNHVIRVIDLWDPLGASISTYAGVAVCDASGCVGQAGFDPTHDASGGAGLSTNLNHPIDVGVADLGIGEDVIVIADWGNHRVRAVYRVDAPPPFTVPMGLHTVAGTGAPGFSLDGPALDTRLEHPRGLSYVNGNLLIVEGYRRVRAMPVAGFEDLLNLQTTLVLGDRDASGDGLLGSAALDGPVAITRIERNHWAIADGLGGRVRLIDFHPSWSIDLDPSWLQESHMETLLGYPDGFPVGQPPPNDLATYTTYLGDAAGMAYDEATGTLYVSDAARHVIVKIDRATRVVAPFAGVVGEPGLQCDTVSACSLNRPTALLLEPAPAPGVARRLLVADTGNHVIRALEPISGGVELVAGEPGHRAMAPIDGDNPPLAVDIQLNAPEGLAFAADGSLYIADTGNHRVLRVNNAGLVELIIGHGEPGNAGEGAPARQFHVDTPRGVVVDSHGNLFITSRTAIRRVAGRLTGGSTVPVATGEQPVATIYGALPRGSYPEPVTRCLSDIGVIDDNTLVFLDECVGFMVQLGITSVPP